MSRRPARRSSGCSRSTRQAQGRGVGRALVEACISRARQVPGCRRLVLSTQPGMLAARRIYESRGFVRDPDRDWSPVPGLTLMAYVLGLD